MSLTLVFVGLRKARDIEKFQIAALPCRNGDAFCSALPHFELLMQSISMLFVNQRPSIELTLHSPQFTSQWASMSRKGC